MTAPLPNMCSTDKPLILLVDDIPANLRLLAAALKADYRIKASTNGPLAIELAHREERPDLILLDVMMPGMSGIEVLSRLRQDTKTRDIPAIFISADSSEQSQLEGLALGADDYLTKPVVATVLRARVYNVLQRRNTERQLRLAAHVFQHSGEAILITDRNNRIVDSNQAFTRLTGYARNEVLGRNPKILASGHTDAVVYRELWEALRTRGFWQGEIWDRDKSGDVHPKLLTISVVPSAQGEVDFYIASFIDISVQKAAEDRIRHIAHHDTLTGLPNRLYLKIALDQALTNARRDEQCIVVMFIDLDRFKVVNDTLGHNIGDELLIAVALRLKACVRVSDLVARLGGDEFVVVLTGQGSANAANYVAEKILTELSRPYPIGSHLLHTTPSIGISLYPQNGADSEALMKCADAAMYDAKRAGRSQFRFYAEIVDQHSHARLIMESHLYQALERAEFVLHYQPQAAVNNGRFIGLEALMRWQHPEHGLVPPDEFIPLAEETGLVVPLGQWMLREVCQQMRRWDEQGLVIPYVAVNLSPRQFRHERLVETFAAIVAEACITPSRLELEITETTAMTQVDTSVRVLNALRTIGFRLAIDDFGTGYSSLSYLKSFPIEKLKIDRSFIRDITDDGNDAAIVAAVIQMAHRMGLTTVAEGVETPQQLKYLRDQDCNFLQGFWYSRPLDAVAFEQFAREQGLVSHGDAATV